MGRLNDRLVTCQVAIWRCHKHLVPNGDQNRGPADGITNASKDGVRTGRNLHTSAARVLIFLSPLVAATNVPQDQDHPRLADIFQRQVDRKLELPENEQRRYADLLGEHLPAAERDTPQYVVLVDRNRFVQAAMIFWIRPDRDFEFIGASPVSTGKPGQFEHFVTPTGVFKHGIENPDFRAEGTLNEFGIRGYGRKGMRVYDFGWQKAEKGWGGGGVGTLRLQMHATDPDRLASRLGTRQSEGCIRIPATLNTFIDEYGILDGDYETAMDDGKTFWVLPKTRKATPWSGQFLVVVDSGRTRRPAWSPDPMSSKISRKRFRKP